MPLRLFPAADWFPAATDWFHRYLGANSLKIAGAFAGGLVVAASWNASWSAMWSGSATTNSSPSQLARVIPQENSNATKQQAPTRDAKAPGTPLAASTPAAKQTPCEQQTWPYIEPHCLEGGDASDRRIRVVSPDRQIQPPTSTQSPRLVRSRETTGVSTAEPVPAQAAVTGTAVAMSAPPTNTVAAEGSAPDTSAADTSAAVPIPPSKPQRTDIVAAVPDTAIAPPTQSREQPSRAVTAALPDNNDGRIKPAASAPDRHADDNRSGDDTGKRRSHYRSDRSERAATTRRRGRDVTVTRTLELPDGRRVTLRQTYRNVPQAHELPEIVPSRRARPSYYRAYSGYDRDGPRAFADR